MGGGYNLCVHNIINIYVYIYIYHIHYIYIHTHTSIHAVYHSTTVYHSISTLNLYQMSASSIRTYQGREMPRTLATQAAGRFKNRQIRQAQWIQCIDERRKVILRLLLKAERIRRLFPCPDVVLNTDRLVFQRHTWTFFFYRRVIFSKFFNLD